MDPVATRYRDHEAVRAFRDSYRELLDGIDSRVDRSLVGSVLSGRIKPEPSRVRLRTSSTGSAAWWEE